MQRRGSKPQQRDRGDKRINNILVYAVDCEVIDKSPRIGMFKCKSGRRSWRGTSSSTLVSSRRRRARARGGTRRSVSQAHFAIRAEGSHPPTCFRRSLDRSPSSETRRFELVRAGGLEPRRDESRRQRVAWPCRRLGELAGLFVRPHPDRSEWIGCAVAKFCHAFNDAVFRRRTWRRAPDRELPRQARG